MSSFIIFVANHKEPKYKLPKFHEYYIGGISPFADLYKSKLRNHYKLNCIYEKSAVYGEVTVLHSIFNDIKNNDITHDVIGFSQYRRIFIRPRFWFFVKNFFHALGFDLSLNAVRLIAYKPTMYKRGTLVVPEPVTFDTSVQEQYVRSHVESDLLTAVATLLELYPEYENAVNKVLKRNYMYPYNMFVMQKQELLNYCMWLFPLLDVIESKLDLTGRTSYQKRAIGFLTERIFNFWLEHNHIKLVTARVAVLEGGH